MEWHNVYAIEFQRNQQRQSKYERLIADNQKRNLMSYILFTQAHFLYTKPKKHTNEIEK